MRTASGAWWLAVAFAGAAAGIGACVGPLPGGPYEAPKGIGVGGAGGSHVSARDGGMPATASCGFSPLVGLSPTTTSPLPAGTSASFDVSITSLDPPGCPPLSSYHIHCFGDPPLSLQQDPTWFTGPLPVGGTLHSTLHVSVPLATAPGSYPFTCSSGDQLRDAHGTYVVGPQGTQGPATSKCATMPAPGAAIFDGFIKLTPYTAAGAGLAPPTIVATSTSPLTFRVTDSPGGASDPSQNWVSFGFKFVGGGCLDASLFSGVEFAIDGDTNIGCGGLSFEALTNEDSSIANSPPGSCNMPTCRPPSSPAIGLGTTTIPFTSLSGGVPMPGVDRTELMGVQWTLHLAPPGACAPCVANLTISGVTFVP